MWQMRRRDFDAELNRQRERDWELNRATTCFTQCTTVSAYQFRGSSTGICQSVDHVVVPRVVARPLS